MKTRRDSELFAEEFQRRYDKAYQAGKQKWDRAAFMYILFLVVCFPFGWFVVGPLMGMWFEWLSS